jgi:hypothetical protein
MTDFLWAVKNGDLSEVQGFVEKKVRFAENKIAYHRHR